MRRIVYTMLFVIITPLQWAVSMIDLGLSKVWQHVMAKLLECMLKDNEKDT